MSPIRMSKIESAIRIVLEFNEAFNRHNVEGMMQLMSDDCTYEDHAPFPDGVVYKGVEAVTDFWDQFSHKYPTTHIKIEEIFGAGERCAMRWERSWLDHEGEKAHIRGVDIYRVRDNLITEHLSYVKG